MAYNYDPFDPEEIRRRQAMNQPTIEDGIMAPDMGDQEEDQQAAAETPSKPANAALTLSPAQQRYRDVLNQTPQMTQYAPSRGRRIAAMVLGGLAGIRDPKAGYEMASDIVSSPYQRALTDWMNQSKSLAAQAGIEKEAANEEIARRRAAAYETSAGARQAMANRSAQHYQFLEEHQVNPLDLEAARHKAKMEEIGLTNAGALDRANAGNKFKVDPIEIERIRHQNRMSEIGAHESAANKRASMHNADRGKMISPNMQAQAEQLAIQQLTRENPAFANFVVSTTGPSGSVYHSIKSADQLPKSHLWNNIDEGLQRDQYADFLSKLKKRKANILSTRSTQSGEESEPGDDWDLEEQDEDEQ